MLDPLIGFYLSTKFLESIGIILAAGVSAG